MGEILEGVRHLAQIVSDISGASREQRTGIEQVNQTISQMEKVTQQNAALVEEASAAMELLEVQARKLVEAVGVFKLGDSQGQPQPEIAPEVAAAAPRLAERPRATLSIAAPRRTHSS
jgi:hypothetical protein